jgi:hypothetical protein
MDIGRDELAIVKLNTLDQLSITRVPQKLKEVKTLIQSTNFLAFELILRVTKVLGTLAIMVILSRNGYWYVVSNR